MFMNYSAIKYKQNKTARTTQTGLDSWKLSRTMNHKKFLTLFQNPIIQIFWILLWNRTTKIGCIYKDANHKTMLDYLAVL